MEEVKFKGTKICYELEDKQGRVGIFTEEYIKEAVAKGEMKISDELAQLLSVNVNNVSKTVKDTVLDVSNVSNALQRSKEETLKWNHDVDIAINKCEKLLRLKEVVSQVDRSIKDGVYLIPYKSEQHSYILYISDKVTDVEWCEVVKGITSNRGKINHFVEKYFIEKLIVVGGRKLTTCCDMFFNCHSLQQLDLSHFDTSNVFNMNDMFDGCISLKQLDLSHFDTFNVEDMEDMFRSCESLKLLDVSHFDTSNVKVMNGMFAHCYSLQQLDVSHFDTSNVTNMNFMFLECESLKQLVVSHFDTSKVTSMQGMFYGCENLEQLDLSNFDTSRVTDMGSMFSRCNSLQQVNLSHFDISNVTNMNNMFWECKSLQQLDLSHFDTSRVTNMNDMFWECKYSRTFKGIEKFNI